MKVKEAFEFVRDILFLFIFELLFAILSILFGDPEEDDCYED